MWLLALAALLGGAYVLNEAASTGQRPSPPKPAKIGADGTDHGRTAHCDEGDSWFNKIGRGFTEIVSTAIRVVVAKSTGGVFDKQLHGLLDDMAQKSRQMKSAELAKWLNHASNEEVVVWAMSQAREYVASGATGNKKAATYCKMIGVAPDDFEGEITRATEATLRWYLHITGGIYYPRCRWQHALQAIAIYCYGGTMALVVLNDALKRPLAKKIERSRENTLERRAWVDETIKALRDFRDAHRPAATFGAAEVPSDADLRAELHGQP